MATSSSSHTAAAKKPRDGRSPYFWHKPDVDELDSYRHEAIALRAIVEQLTEPCPDCAVIPDTPGTVAAPCGKPGCYAGRVNRLAAQLAALKAAGDELADALRYCLQMDEKAEPLPDDFTAKWNPLVKIDDKLEPSAWRKAAAPQPKSDLNERKTDEEHDR